MTIDQALAVLTDHRNGTQVYDYTERKEAMKIIKHLVVEWIQRIDNSWQLVVIGYHDD